MRSHRRQRCHGVTPPDQSGERRLLWPPLDNSIGMPRPATARMTGAPVDRSQPGRTHETVAYLARDTPGPCRDRRLSRGSVSEVLWRIRRRVLANARCRAEGPILGERMRKISLRQCRRHAAGGKRIRTVGPPLAKGRAIRSADRDYVARAGTPSWTVMTWPDSRGVSTGSGCAGTGRPAGVSFLRKPY